MTVCVNLRRREWRACRVKEPWRQWVWANKLAHSVAKHLARNDAFRIRLCAIVRWDCLCLGTGENWSARQRRQWNRTNPCDCGAPCSFVSSVDDPSFEAVKINKNTSILIVYSLSSCATNNNYKYEFRVCFEWKMEILLKINFCTFFIGTYWLYSIFYFSQIHYILSQFKFIFIFIFFIFYHVNQAYH